MSNRKYHSKKHGRSNYKQRLKDRGLGKSPVMPSVESLRNRQPRADTYDSKRSQYQGLFFKQKGIPAPWNKFRE